MTLGGVYALMAAGLTLVFGVMRIVNLAHAAFIIVAAYIAFFAFTIYKIDPIISVLITMPVMFLIGIAVYKLFFSRISGTARSGELTVLLTFALALIVEGILGYFFSNIYRSANPSYATEAIHFDAYILPSGQFYATLLSIGLIVLLWAFLKYSRTGYAIRATMQNLSAAQVVGVNVERMSMIAFGIGMALAGASGSMMSFLFTFYPAKHWEWIAILLALIVLGGMGSLGGALVGAFILAISSAIIGNYFGPTWSPITFFLALFVILLFRPQGLFGKKMEA
jgi:branched-chain amino acid transport system permease protein